MRQKSELHNTLTQVHFVQLHDYFYTHTYKTQKHIFYMFQSILVYNFCDIVSADMFDLSHLRQESGAYEYYSF